MEESDTAAVMPMPTTAEAGLPGFVLDLVTVPLKEVVSNVVEQLLAGEHLAGVAQEDLRQPELPAGQLHLPAAGGGAPGAPPFGQ